MATLSLSLFMAFSVGRSGAISLGGRWSGNLTLVNLAAAAEKPAERDPGGLMFPADPRYPTLPRIRGLC
jgi:hypothetical protein